MHVCMYVTYVCVCILELKKSGGVRRRRILAFLDLTEDGKSNV